MKLQLQNDSLRVRIDEAELAALQSGESLTLALGDPARPLFSMQLWLGGEPALQTDAVAWQLLLPSAAVADYVQTLPNRHALELSTTTAPALAATGPNSRATLAPALNSATSTPAKESWPSVSTRTSEPANVSF